MTWTRGRLEELRRALLDWYRAGHRDLPWRRTRDPYRIWVSEIMLQQTQVDTVAPRYGTFLERFPTVAELASATEAEVCEAWAGLGFYRRARNLHRGALFVRDSLEGRLPGCADEWQAVPGVGRYTAGAIASIALGESSPIVDGNVARILSRICELEEQPLSTPGQKQLWALASQLAIGPDPGAFNQAMMELGATVCSPRSPKCELCPVVELCGAFRAGDVERYPPAKPAAKRKPLRVAFAWIADDGGLWLEQRPTDGLWAGLWEPPSAATRKALAERLPGMRLGTALAKVEHTLSHRDVVATVYRCTGDVRPEPHWKHLAEPLSAPLSALSKKAIVAARAAMAL